ncbi:hypothetical protein AHiyo8_46280 [Arthrobacter sp. Hiyo8]|nr:hypothetical protein AHiyo8_46280 [Arthrobacter sp. Hiyo8]
MGGGAPPGCDDSSRLRWSIGRVNSNRVADYFVPAPESVILRASHSCHLDGSAYATLGDGGYTITMKGEPDGKTTGLPVKDMACVLKAVSVPDSVVSQMDSTRALDGMQKASWDKFAASWTYHPDNGLRIILTESK